MEPLNHQRAALDEITARARAYFRGDWRGLDLQCLWHSLMLGPTGTGKTAVAAMAAAALSGSRHPENPDTTAVSLMRVSAPNWMPAGTHQRATKQTLSVIAAHVGQHDRTLLVIDEIDKLIAGPGGTAAGSDTWQSYIRAELYDLLDGRWPVGLKDSDGDDISATDLDALTTKLRTTVFIVGIGTFQSWFDSSNSRRSMGFAAEIDPRADELSADIIAEKLPRELANRFNSGIIRIPELMQADYHRVANEAAAKLPLRMRQAFCAEVERRIPAAIAAKKGVRLLEEAMMEVLKTLPPEPTKPTAELIKLGLFKTPDREPCTL